MNFERFLAYGLVAILLVFAFTRSRRSFSFKAHRVQGNVVIGDTAGPITQTYTATPARAGERKKTDASGGDRVAWGIGIVAALIAAAQLAFDFLK